MVEPKDYKTKNEVRWCPGCGDYAILNSLQKAFAQLELDNDKVAVVSGIGCSSRLPYYMETYGFHTVHGRAPTVALGLKAVQPDLSVWMITGDGDALSIGANHLIHLIRRNVNVNIILFNNEIYGLTKGQASPTSKAKDHLGRGSIPSKAIQALPLGLAAGATFAARVADSHRTLMTDVFKAAAGHNGTSLVEVLVNCPIFNDKAHKTVTDKKSRGLHTLTLEKDQPLVFGEGQGIAWQNLGPTVVDGSDASPYSAASKDPLQAIALASMSPPDFPVALGILRQVSEPTFEEQLQAGRDKARATQGLPDIGKVLRGPESWVIS